MTKDMINFLKTQYGEENIKAIYLDNARVFNVPEKVTEIVNGVKTVKKKGFKALVWDDVNEVITQVSDAGRSDTSVEIDAADYDCIQSIIFNKPSLESLPDGTLTAEEIQMIKDFKGQ